MQITRPLRHQKAQVLFLDVFDTALTRLVGPPPAVYLLLGNRLARARDISCSPEVFARTRHRAELDVWYRVGGLDAQVSLDDLYQETLRLLGMGTARQEEFIEAELELEARLLRPNPQVAELVRRKGERGWRIVFVSDTYFDSSFIVRQLERHGLWPSSAQLIASSDHPTSKASGGLFEVALERAESGREHVLHAGDNDRSDVAMPRRHNIRAVALPDGRLNRYEELLADRMWSTSGTSAVLAGASRLARLSTPVDNAHERAIRDVAAGVAAPFLTAYLLWVLRLAEQQQLKRLAFISRDGQVMVEMARRLASKLGIAVECTYLHASRDAVNLAATFDATPIEMSWVERDCAYLTPRRMLSRFDLTWDDLQASWPHAEVLGPDDAPETGASRRLFEFVSTDRGLKEEILQRASSRREFVLAYLKQEGLLGEDRVGLIDFGGVGSQMRSLHELIRRAGSPPPKMFLVGLDSPEAAGLQPEPVTQPWLDDTSCYLYDHRRKVGVRRRRGFGTMVQMFCAADHGSVVGYDWNGRRIEPVLTEEEDVALLEWGLPVLRRTVDIFLDALVLDRDLVDPSADLHEVVTATIDLLWSEPSRSEASAWGSFPFEGAQAGGAPRAALAYRYTWLDVIAQVRSGRFPNLGWMHWFHGSVRLSGPSIRLAARLVYRSYEKLMSSSGAVGKTAVTYGRKVLRRSR